MGLTAGISNANQVAPGGWNLDGLFFDAWLRLDHKTGLTITQFPVETGAAITDHSFVNPRRWAFEIGMSDIATSIVSGQFPANPTRSINAYNALLNRQESRTLMRLVTKYTTSDGVLIEEMSVDDDWQTSGGARINISLVEPIFADVRTIKVSAHPQVTDTTNRGPVSPQPTPGTIDAILNDLRNLVGP